MKLFIFAATITFFFSSYAFATFPGENGKIAYTDGGGYGEIRTVNPDGSDDTFVYFPAAWLRGTAPDGSRFSFEAGSDIVIINSDGTNPTFIHHSIPGGVFWPVFSADGTAIIYVANYADETGLHGGIWKVNLDGTNASLILADPNYAPGVPVVSPDGLKIAFQNQGHCQIYVMDWNGSNIQQLTFDQNTTNSNFCNYDPDWSPLDGHARLIYTHVETTCDEYDSLDCVTEYSLRRIDSDGTNVVTILQGIDTIGSIANAVWSPDGTKIAYTDYADGLGITLIDSNGSNPIRITPNDGHSRGGPKWIAVMQPSSYTPAGTNVTVRPFDSNTGTAPVTIEFSSILAAGESTVLTSTSGPTPPSGFQVGDPAVFYDISSTATFIGPITVCLNWLEGQFAVENNLALFHYENGAWLDVTTSLDTNHNEVCGQTYSLSPFALFQKAFEFSGFFPPVDNPPIRNVAKAGSAIPVKFSLGGDQGLAIFSAGYPGSQSIECAGNAPTSDIEETVLSGGSSLTYDAISGQYTYVWKTNKAWANACRRLTLKFTDGTIKTAEFTFTK